MIGIDEVGRGALAGPVVAAAVRMQGDVPGLNDSKLLSAKRRAALAAEIRRAGSDIGIGWVPAGEVDRIGLTAAVGLAMRRAYALVASDPAEHVIIDGNYNYLPDIAGAQAVIKADGSVASVSAASIIAKVARDTYMRRLAARHPAYAFDAHVGYGTKAHLSALAAVGPSVLHRYSVAPIRQIGLL